MNRSTAGPTPCVRCGHEVLRRLQTGALPTRGLACGLDASRCPEAWADARTLECVHNWLADLDLRGRLRDHGVRPDPLEALTGQTWEDLCDRTNAVPVTREDLWALGLEGR